MQQTVPSYIIAIIIGIVIILVSSGFLIRKLLAIPPLRAATGENARFMNYLSCAIAMCSADRIEGSSNDGCDSIEVESIGLEYELKTLKKGCRELCVELRDKVLGSGNSARYYCGEPYAFNYTFQEDVAYKANYTDYLNSINAFTPFTGISGKNDILKYKIWRGELISEGCWACGGSEYVYILPDSVGWLFKNSGCSDIPNRMTHGQIWVSDTYGNCINSVSDPGKYEQCSFNKGNTIYIWADRPIGVNYNCVLWYPWGSCAIVSCAGPYHACPHVAICENAV